MIEQKQRNEYAQLLRNFLSGKVTNFEYENIFENIDFNSDEAINQIYCEMWYTYCDLNEHKLNEEDRGFENRESREAIVRFILFLHSEYEYEWPISSIKEELLRILTFGKKGISEEKKLKNKLGDREVWPFYKKLDYEHALSNPNLLGKVRI